MALQRLDHVNVRTARLPALVAFYREALGMSVGPRPAFSFGGAWLYCGDRPVVHLVEVAQQPVPGTSLQLEHMAFAAAGFAGFCRNLDDRGIPYRVGQVTDFRLLQVHLTDPDGNHLHVDFPLDESESPAGSLSKS